MSTVDLSPALKELTKLYTALLDKIKEESNFKGTRPADLKRIRSTVVAIAPKDRRTEDGWYRPAKWESHTDKAVAIMADETAKPIDEIFISGEALNQSAMDITQLMLHQVVHQLTNTFWADKKMSYHSSAFASIYTTLGFDVERNKKGGWLDVDFKPDRLGFMTHLQEVADQIDMTEFDAFRTPAGATVTIEGRMRKWHCDCIRAPKLYTGAVVFAVCDICKQPIRYQHKDRTDPAVVAWLTGKGLPTDRIGT